VRDVLRTYLFA